MRKYTGYESWTAASLLSIPSTYIEVNNKFEK